jgi:SAM-dependent methyltransferase
MSSPLADTLTERLERYYTRYYRDTLGIPGWRDIVAVRLDDRAYEGRRLARLERAVGRAVGGCRLLDLGCGTGGFGALAEEAGAEVWSVDASPEAAALAASRSRRGRIVVATAESLPLAGASFDLVYCYSTLEHLDDPAGAVREMVRVLRPGGLLYLHTPNRWGCFEGHYKIFWIPGLPRRLSRAYLAARGRPTAFLATLRPLTSAECRALIERAGARVTRVVRGDAERAVGGPVWPLVRLYYRLFNIDPYVELVAVRDDRQPANG